MCGDVVPLRCTILNKRIALEMVDGIKRSHFVRECNPDVHPKHSIWTPGQPNFISTLMDSVDSVDPVDDLMNIQDAST
ncbi:hypothetical protein AAMO2058_001254700 [Amorphochlora amoebiformis]